ncbi:recombinase family protein [Neobacillus sp. MM2021_6]|uniref:recombinase family protein n=1 Tax=Bacillaceae TaxID=186817 RepID=UPI0014082E9D|nr:MULTISPECIES: recombinase family protein [Bacillaceae]MBO0959522.1 recombinase family protein [Neobacillus sp. MM2021_6]NHC17180.1 recombinase family protein [Bacillus sp. MM2020_4]
MKVAAYIRVSTTEQAEEGYSIAAQRNRLEAYATSQGWEIVAWYVDEGESAKDLNRTDLKRMLNGIEQEIFDCVLVYRLDRLTRSVLDLYQLLEKFEKHNVKFKSATEVYDTTTAIGRLFLTLVSALAQWERENLGERVRMGMQQKAKEGKWTVSTPPLGYDSEESNLKINPSEAAVVKEIYSLYLAGNGMHKIARNLNERGLYTKSNKAWSQNTVQYILTNPIYHGTTRYNYRVNKDQYFEVDDVVPVIIPDEEFELTQLMINQRKNVHPRQATSKFIFSKVLKCARCGKTLIGKTSQSKRGDKTYYAYSYYCPNRQRSLCDLPLISQNLFEQKFIQMTEQWDLYQEANELNQKEAAATIEDHTETIETLKQELKDIEKRRSKWQYAWANEIITDKDFQKRMNEESEKEKLIQSELKDLSYKEESTSQIGASIELWTNLKLNWQHMTDETKKQFILITVNSMTVDKINKEKTPESIGIKEVRFN